MTIVFLGIDLAKNVFAVHGVNTAGKAERVRPNVPRAKLHELIAALPACTIGMEACSGAHHWARRFQALGHTVKLTAPKHGVGGAGQGRQIRNAGLYRPRLTNEDPARVLHQGLQQTSCVYDRL